MDVRRHDLQPGSPGTGEASHGRRPDRRAAEGGPGAPSPDAPLATLDERQLERPAPRGPRVGPGLRQPRGVAASAARRPRASAASPIPPTSARRRFGRFVPRPERAAARGGGDERGRGAAVAAGAPRHRAAARAARTSPEEHRDRARADAQAGGAAGALGGRALLGRLRPRSDARDPRPRPAARG